jgi:predicted nucleic acid-binding Zn ribbon protein
MIFVSRARDRLPSCYDSGDAGGQWAAPARSRRKTVPTYEYRCEANGRLVEVRHKMAERLATWAELCERAGIAPGKTNPGAPVEKLISAGFINAGSSTSISEPACEAPSCGNGFCGTGACGMGD